MPAPKSKQTVAKQSDTSTKKQEASAPVADKDGNVINVEKSDEKTINLSLDEWIGWKEIIDANGGLTTTDGSIYDNLGINVNISVINDATQSSNALISGKLDAAGYTINRTAFLSQKFSEANFDVVMPYITNFSNGGDGIIAKSNIKSVKDFVGAKIGVPQFSEAHSLVIWFVNQSDDLTDKEKQSIIDSLVFFETPDEAAKAFFAGKLDVAATWEPYLTQATSMTDAHVFFSTASSSSLIMDGILFNKDFAEKYPDTVAAFIDGALQAADMYATDADSIKRVMPMFSCATDDEVFENCAAAKLTTYADNLNLFDGTAKTIYSDMCGVWGSIGEATNGKLVETLFDSSYIKTLADKYSDSEVTKAETAKVTKENEKEIIDAAALLTKRATVEFQKSTAIFTDSAKAGSVLDDFIATAKVLDGSIIEIAGNCDPNPISDPKDKLNKKLSYSRAETVKKYFVMNGIDADRIVVVGNGSKNPIVKNDSEKHRAMNRRVDVSFKMIEL
jgi:NitT/TauT family transport system substrate-binding protein